MNYFTIFTFPFFLMLSCTPKNTPLPENVPTSMEVVSAPIKDPNVKTEKPNICCTDNESYIPDPDNLDYFAKRYVRVNVHVMYDGEGKNNIPKTVARKKMEEIIFFANIKMRDNCKMNLPQGNDTPVLPTEVRMKLTPPRPGMPDSTAIYFHDDEELYAFIKRGKNENRGRKEVIEKYGVQLDSVLNIFIMPHHPDSIKSKRYKSDVTGIALLRHSALKIAGFHANPQTPVWEFSKTVNHEVGHMLSLNHSWRKSDGCDDTPPHANCWHYTNNGSECDSLVSNNLMDYNAENCALTPCQIGRMHKVLSMEKYPQRKWLIPTFCRYDARKDVTILDSVHFAGAKDIFGDVIIGDGGVLTVSCRLSLPEGGKITVLPGGKLILNNNKLHNACGYAWKGIRVLSENGRKGEVEMPGNPIFENVTGEPISEMSLD